MLSFRFIFSHIITCVAILFCDLTDENVLFSVLMQEKVNCVLKNLKMQICIAAKYHYTNTYVVHLNQTSLTGIAANVAIIF